MNALLIHLAMLSAKAGLLIAIAWIQLWLLRRAPAAWRSRLCTAALLGVFLLALAEFLAPRTLLSSATFTISATSRASAQAASSANSIAPWLSLIWLAGVAFMAARATAGRGALMLARRRSEALDRAGALDVRIGDVQTAVLCGLVRPAILLPRAVVDWTPEQRSMVVVHELTHFRQGDCWSNALAQFVRAALWFHPAVWWLAARLSREQELVCDEAVVAAGHSANDYASFLLHTVRNLKSQEMFACAMAGSGSRSLKMRFENLLNSAPRRDSARRAITVLAMTAVAAAGLSVVKPVWSQERQIYRVGGGVLAPRVLNMIQPSYTEEARAAKISGTVMLSLVVNEEGTPESIVVMEGIDPGLDRNAADALAKWTFAPATKDGKVVAVKATVEINYRLK